MTSLPTSLDKYKSRLIHGLLREVTDILLENTLEKNQFVVLNQESDGLALSSRFAINLLGDLEGITKAFGASFLLI